MSASSPQIDWDCHDDHFLRIGPEAWYTRPANNDTYGGSDVHLDFAHNWWGTDDPDKVSTWIYDGYDDPGHERSPGNIADFVTVAENVEGGSSAWSEIEV